MKKLTTLILWMLITLQATAAVFEADSDFLKRQEAFWIKIYTQYSVDQTVIHDRFEPTIIYKVVDHPNANHTQRRKIVINALREVRAALKNIQRKKFQRLNTTELNLMSRIGPTHKKDFNKRLRGVRYQQGMKEKFQVGLVRSHLYLDAMKEILTKYGVPAELAYLPHVESSFNYKAYSRVGAAGIWQFMRGSAKTYKLKMNDIIDERLDPLKAAKAAARMLRDNYRILGKWPLAVTAYNHGPYGMKKVVNRLGTTDITKIILNNKRRSFSFASENFYASFLAAIEVSTNFQKYYSDLKVDPPIDFKKIQIAKAMTIKNIMKKYGLSRDEFRFYNPNFKYSAIKRNLTVPKGTTIHLPGDPKAVYYSLKNSGARFF
ncbi:MAG: lytic transglycosylase domain-containing protein [Halobacteriovoraceae bacterium]|nr:lytic transglycosylase domain-containing protein [Halobacteriovoraceae bacterium]